MKTSAILKSAGETAAAISSQQLVDGVKLLEILFPPESRPTLRWLRDQQAMKRIPHLKIGRLVFFDPTEVRKAWKDRFQIGKQKGCAE